MRFTANDIPRLRLEIERGFDGLDSPQQPKRVFACATADRPPAADFPFCLLFDTTLGALKVSDGSSWV